MHQIAWNVVETLLETVLYCEPKPRHRFVFKSSKHKQMNKEEYRFLNFEAQASAQAYVTLVARRHYPFKIFALARFEQYSYVLNKTVVTDGLLSLRDRALNVSTPHKSFTWY
jgi:hypothetical protein